MWIKTWINSTILTRMESNKNI